MEDFSLRTELLLGKRAALKLSKCRVAVFGLGGVGGYAAEALARAGVGALDLIDGDVISATNINRQILALSTTVGQSKAEAAAERVRLINQKIDARALVKYFNADTGGQFDFNDYDYVIDAIDTITNKLLLAECCKAFSVPLISCMGTGNKLDASAFKVADISETSVCPVARVMRRELKKRGIEKLKVVYSEEPPANSTVEEGGRHAPGSVSFVPPVAGFIMAGEAIKDLLAKCD